MPDHDTLTRPDAETAAAPDTASGRALPANLEAEAAFLGAVLIDNGLIEEVGEKVQPEHFFAPIHARIFERIKTLIDRQMVVSPVTLKPYFQDDEALKELGGTAYLAQLYRRWARAAGHARSGAANDHLALLRELVTVGRTLVDKALDTSEEVEPMRQIEQAEADLFRVAEGSVSENQSTSFRVAAMTAIKMAEAAMNRRRLVRQNQRAGDDRSARPPDCTIPIW